MLEKRGGVTITSKFRSRLELHTIVGVSARHILPYATDVCVKEQLNGSYYVTFTYPRLPDDSERYDALVERNEVRFPSDVERGQAFVIKRAEEERRDLRVYKRIEAHHVAFELNRFYLDEYVDFSANQPPTYQLGLIGNGTPFTFAVEGSFNNTDVFEFGEKRKHELLNEVRTLYSGDLSYDNTEITLTTRKGSNNGVVIRYRKNLVGISRKSHDMERVTRLYGYGKNGLTIEGLPGYSVKYIDSQYADPAHIFEGSIDFPEIEDQSRLLAEMQRHLATVDLPKVSYEIDFVELEKIDDEFKSEAIREVGDTITVIDESMGYRFDARITEYERYPFEPKRGRVVLANFREMKTSDYIFQATVGSRKAMVYTSENAVLKGIKYDDSITLVDGLGMAVSDELDRVRVRLGQVEPGNYGFAAYNKAGVKTIWLDADTGDGRFNGKLVGSEIEGGTITGAVINGTEINGGRILGAHFATNGEYPKVEISNTENMIRAYASALRYLEIRANDSGYPQLYLNTESGFLRLMHSGSAGSLGSSGNFVLSTTGDLLLNATSSSSDIEIAPGSFGYILVPNWGKLMNSSNSRTLQQELNAKADIFAGVSGTVYVASSPGGPTDRAITFTNGVRVS